MELIITAGGAGRCVYSEELNLASLGRLTIERGSHVEPNAQGHWMADLSPVNGPLLGPYATRSAALQAEIAWLHENWLPRSG